MAIDVFIILLFSVSNHIQSFFFKSANKMCVCVSVDPFVFPRENLDEGISEGTVCVSCTTNLSRSLST